MIVLRLLFIVLCFWSSSQFAEDRQEVVTLSKKAAAQKNDILFSFEKKPLIDILTELSAKKGVNLILPQNPSDLELLKSQTIIHHPQGRTFIPISEAWDLVHTFLELSGFGISPKKKNLYVVEKIGRAQEPGLDRSILPIYVNVDPDHLPHSQEHIRYIYTDLDNLLVPDEKDKDTNPIARILRDMLSPGAPVVFEPKTNSFIITDKSDTVSSVIRVIKELDHSGFREKLEIIALNNVPAQDIVKIFDSLRAAAGDNSAPILRGDARTESLSYFSEDTKIVADPRQNTLLIMGREAAVERISEFIRDHMDSPPESGTSILHSYDLQYLDAAQFAKILTQVVSPLPPTGGQATAGESSGPERYFQGVVIAAEEIKVVDIKSTTEEITLEARGGYLPTGIGQQQTFTGGNRLVIAALQDDWLRLRDLIESLDKPQPYVILEVMIVDVRATKQKIIAGSVRNKTVTSTPTNGFEALSTNISDVNSALGNKPTKLADDLLKVLTVPNSSNPSLTSLLEPGSLIVSFNDTATPGIFGLLQILDKTLNSKILSHPYLVTTNNQKATLASQDLRRRRGDAVPGAAGVITVEIVDLPATLQVQMIPRLSSLKALSLQVAVDINEFIDANSDTRITRRVNANANMESGQVLVIGGLTRTDQIDSNGGTPILSSLPLIGSFFSRKSKAVTKNNLAIFVSPTIVQPRLREGLNRYTNDKIRKARRDVDNSAIFGDTIDPITKIFFQASEPTDKVLHTYLENVNNAPAVDVIRTKKERTRLAKKSVKNLPKAPLVASQVAGPVSELPL